jgi:hypothetical protein
MATVPRVRDTLQISRAESSNGSADEFIVRDPADNELFRLTPEGYFILLSLDGLRDSAELRAGYEEHFGRGIREEDLQNYINALGEAGVLTTDDRAIKALSYLRDNGVQYRSGRPDRRLDLEDETNRDEVRRESESPRTSWFDLGIYHLNDGDVEHALSIFRRMSAAQSGDLRVREIIKHLEFVQASEKNPELTENRRDVSWDAFDDALSTILNRGACPRCDEPFEVQLGATNHCSYCGAGFSAFVLHKAAESRRVAAPAES